MYYVASWGEYFSKAADLVPAEFAGKKKTLSI